MSKLPRLLPLVAIAIGGVIAVRAAGTAPGLFQGAVAWAEEAVPAEGTETPTPPVTGVCTLTDEQLADQAGISPAELRVIQSLSGRRVELDAREEEMATMLPLLIAAEQKIDARIVELNAVKGEVETMLGQLDEKEQAEVDRLVQVYSAMRPRDAAAVFTTLSDDVRLPVAAAMRPRALAAIMAQMPPAAARELTEKLANRNSRPDLEARAQAATQGAPTPVAAPPAATPPAPARTQPAAQTPARSTPARQTPPARSQPAQTPPARQTPPAATETPATPPAADAGTRTPARQTVQ
jgi:flagellar motility protein MotE (MotC chaperone)